MSLYRILHDEATGQGLPWEEACRRAGITKQGAEYALRASQKGPPLALVHAFARVLSLDRASLEKIWASEREEACRRRIAWEIVHAQRPDGMRVPTYRKRGPKSEPR